ncbi:MAG: acyl-CoA reductase [Ruminiclostridium sp.]
MLKINKIENMKILCPREDANILSATNKVFEDTVISFFDNLSKVLLSNSKYRDYPDIIAMAFWLRRANLLRIKQQFMDTYSNRILLARGVAFHIAPSNVDTIFMYSMAISLLAGNTNIVRVSEKSSDRVSLIIGELNKLLQSEHHMQLKNNILIVSYGHDDKITEYFSSISDVRIIWGGNETVKRIRKIPCKPRCIDIPFADRYSFSVFNADVLLKDKDLKSICNKFYNDCYTFDQNACSSPRAVVWLGDENSVKEAKKIFWAEVEKLANKKYNLQPANAVDKIMTSYSLAIEKEDTKLVAVASNSLVRIEVGQLDNIIHNIRCAAGFFVECRINKLTELEAFITEDDQTMTTYGISKGVIEEFISNNKPRGIDRVVELGQALDFSEIWDGFDLLRELTREVSVY